MTYAPTSSSLFQPHPATPSSHGIPQHPLAPLVGTALALAHQGHEILAQLSDSQLSFESQAIPGSSVGKHFRHIHDHYRILLTALAEMKKEDVEIPVNYDERHLTRSTEIENSVVAAKAAYSSLQRFLLQLVETFSKDIGERNVRLLAVTPERVEMLSTVARELWFASHHAIHHYSLSRVILTKELGLKVADDFGVAPSTIVSKAFKQGSKL